MAAMGAVERALENLVRFLRHVEREFTFAHGAREDLHEVAVHEDA